MLSRCLWANFKSSNPATAGHAAAQSAELLASSGSRCQMQMIRWNHRMENTADAKMLCDCSCFLDLSSMRNRSSFEASTLLVIVQDEKTLSIPTKRELLQVQCLDKILLQFGTSLQQQRNIARPTPMNTHCRQHHIWVLRRWSIPAKHLDSTSSNFGKPHVLCAKLII